MPISAAQQISQIKFSRSVAELNFIPKNVRIECHGKAEEALHRDDMRAKQVHGTTVVEMQDVKGRQEQILADGVFTRARRQRIATVTADCVPVLLCDVNGSIAMALHAGWRGLTAGILSRGLEILIDEGIDPRDARVVIGPCISQENYEVGPEVRDAICAEHLGLNQQQQLAVLQAGRGDRCFPDLALAGALSLVNKGIPMQCIGIIRRCTFSEADHLFSYRRTKIYEGNNFSALTLL